jgi:hypothetical protein
MPKTYLNSKSVLNNQLSEINPMIRIKLLICLLMITFFLPTAVLANDTMLPFGKDLALNIEVFRKIIEDEYVPFLYLDGTELIKDDWKELPESKKQSNIKRAVDQYTKSMKKKLVALAESQNKPGVEAFIHYLYGRSIMDDELDGHEEKAFDEFKNAIIKLTISGNHENEIGIQPRVLYKQIHKSVLSLETLERLEKLSNKLKESDEPQGEVRFKEFRQLLTFFRTMYRKVKGQFLERSTNGQIEKLLKRYQQRTNDAEAWANKFLTDDYFMKSPYYQDGLALVKNYQINSLYYKDEYKKAFDICSEFIIAFPKNENFLKNVKLLKVLEKELNTDTYKNLEKRQWSAIVICCPIVSMCLGLLLLYIARKWPEINIFSKSKQSESSKKLLKLPNVKFPEDLQCKIRYDGKILFFKGIMSKEEKNKLLNLSQEDLSYKNAIEVLFEKSQPNGSAEERLGSLCLHYNDPLMYILNPQKSISNFNNLVAKWPCLFNNLKIIRVIRLFRNRLFELSFYAFIFMFVLHFLFALLDNNLYFNQGGILSGILDIASGDFEKISKTFLTWPMGHSLPQKEYFFNDYYGLGVNSIINPLICILIFIVYRNFGDIWQRLFEEKILEFKSEQFIDEFFNYVERIFNRRWYFWACFLVSLLTAFWMWHSVYNQPYRDSYLDFGEGIVPIYHLLYLALTWYIMLMFAFKTVAAATLIKRLFIDYVDQNKVELNLKPMHMDGCSGLSYFGGYMIKVQIVLFLITLSVSARTILDFIMVDTPIHALPPNFIGFAIYAVFTPLMSILPLYYIRKAIMSSKKKVLKKYEDEITLQQSELMQAFPAKNPDTKKLDYLVKLTTMSSLIKNIPNLPLDYKFLSGYVSSLAIPFFLQVHQLIKIFSA